MNDEQSVEMAAQVDVGGISYGHASEYTAILITAETDEQAREMAHRILDPLRALRARVEILRERGVSVREVVVDVDGDQTELSFAEFAQTYAGDDA